MSSEFTSHDLEAYLDEALDVREMAAIETALRADPQLLATLAELQGTRDDRGHSLSSIWRRHRLSCPSREELSSLLLDCLDAEQRDYVYFHITEVGCRVCQANLQDLERQSKQQDVTESRQRRQRYFQSSAGLLPRREPDA